MTSPEETASRFRNAVWRIQTARKIVQFLSLLLFVAVVFGLGPFPIVLPVMFTLGLQQQALGDAFAMLQVMLHDLVFPWIPLASFFLVAAFLGRSLMRLGLPLRFGSGPDGNRQEKASGGFG